MPLMFLSYQPSCLLNKLLEDEFFRDKLASVVVGLDGCAWIEVSNTA